MYKKKIPFDIDCGIKITMEVIGGKMEKLHHSGIMHWSETSQRAASFIYRGKSPGHQSTTERIGDARHYQQKDIHGASSPFGICYHRIGKDADSSD